MAGAFSEQLLGRRLDVFCSSGRALVSPRTPELAHHKAVGRRSADADHQAKQTRGGLTRLTTDRARAARDTAGREPPSVWGCSDAIAIMIVPTLLWISFALHADGLPTLLWSVLCSARRRTLLPAPGPAERTVRNILTLVARHARLITPRAARHRAPRRLSRARGGGGFWRPAGRAARMCRSIQRGGRLLTVHCSGGPLCGQ
jgi:hypothetical protein